MTFLLVNIDRLFMRVKINQKKEKGVRIYTLFMQYMSILSFHHISHITLSTFTSFSPFHFSHSSSRRSISRCLLRTSPLISVGIRFHGTSRPVARKNLASREFQDGRGMDNFSGVGVPISSSIHKNWSSELPLSDEIPDD